MKITPIDIATHTGLTESSVRRRVIAVAKKKGKRGFKYSREMNLNDLAIPTLDDIVLSSKYEENRNLATEFLRSIQSGVLMKPKNTKGERKDNRPVESVSGHKMTYSSFCDQFGSQNLIKYDDSWCVYFLVNDDEIVYVGKSSKGGVWARLKSHKKDKLFDSYFVMDGLKSELEALDIEGSFITLINPKYNKTGFKTSISQIHTLVNWWNGTKADDDSGVTVKGNYLLRVMPHSYFDLIGCFAIMLLISFFIGIAIVSAYSTNLIYTMTMCLLIPSLISLYWLPFVSDIVKENKRLEDEEYEKILKHKNASSNI